MCEDFGKKSEKEPFPIEWNWAPNSNDPVEILNILRKGGSVPITLINTRDCFAYDLKYTEEISDLAGRKGVVKKEY